MQTQNVIAQPKLDLDQTMEHLVQLIHRPSITPDDAGCQQYLSRIFNRMGMVCHSFEVEGVSNLVAKIGTGKTRIAFAGHTDVVPAPFPEQWSADPFALTEVNNQLIGRGIADMKGGIASMLTAFEQVLAHLDLDQFCFYFLITSDEEGEAEYGTSEIMDYLKQQNEVPHYCIIGEPSSQSKVGDVIKVGRRGSVSGEVVIQGVQGHVAYPQDANNAAHKAMMLGKWLSELSWDEGSKDFPGSQLQITSIDTGTWTDNIIPGQCALRFNVRYSHKQSKQLIIKRITDGLMQLKQLTTNIEIKWSRPCEPYYTNNSNIVDDVLQQPDISPLSAPADIDLIAEVERAIFNELKLFPRLSMSGGTSDGRFIAAAGCQVVELGLPNHSIHKTDEHVTKQDLHELTTVYKAVLLQLMG
jgi:succinyl-diaminopimelate desuccinylase